MEYMEWTGPEIKELKIAHDAAIARAEQAEAALARCGDELDDKMAQRDSAEAALAAVPVAEIRRIIEMHDAHQWSSVESPPLYAAVRSWLEVQP